MKQVLHRSDWDLMSEKVHDKILHYIDLKDWVTEIDNERIPHLQLTIGQLLEICQDNDISYTLHNNQIGEPIDNLWHKIIRHYTESTEN